MTKKTTFLSGRSETVKLKKKKGRTISSKKWLQRQLNDPFVMEAKKKGYLSRAAFKLLELDETFDLFKKKCRVIDLGAAPGGWTQVVLEKVDTSKPESQVIALDILPMDALEGAICLQMDFTKLESVEELYKLLKGPADVVLSDMAPPSTGHKSTDHLRIIALSEMALDFALKVLAPGGTFISKVWQGGSDADLLKNLKKHFKTVKHVKPQASRKESAEIYVVALDFKKA
ncbi:MAG: RlmE family RNA methyltransferase [Alphaproteobacteria bacterium]